MHRRLEGQSNVPLTLYNIKIVGKGVELMKYIIYHSNDKVSRADGRKELLKQISQLRKEDIEDIRKMYKSGVTDSVLELYKSYMC